MKKLALLLSAIWFALFAYGQQTVYFEENFDNAGTNNFEPLNLPGWVIDTVDVDQSNAEQRIWVFYNDIDGVAHVSAYQMDADTTEAWMITPAITLTSTGNPIEMTFDLKIGYTVENPLVHQLRVMISTDFDGSDFLSATWDTLAYQFDASDADGTYGDWHTQTIDLSDYADQTVYIAFVYNGSSSYYTTSVRVNNLSVHDVPSVPILQSAYTYDDNTIVLTFDKDASSITADQISLSAGLNTSVSAVQVDSDNPQKLIVTTDPAMTADGSLDTVTVIVENDTMMTTFFGGVLPLKYVNPACSEFVGFGAEVTVRGTVIEHYAGSNGYLSAVISDGTGPLHGIEIWDVDAAGHEIGDSIILRAAMSQYYSYPELTDAQDIRLVGLASTMPEPVTLEDQTILDTNVTDPTAEAMKYIATLVKLVNVTSQGYTDKAWNSYWVVLDQDGNPYYIDNRFYKDNDVDFSNLLGAGAYNIVGLVAYTYGNYTINPRNSSDVTVYTTSAQDIDAQIRLFPNPATNYITISAQSINKLEIYTTSGQLLRTIEVNSPKAKINISDLPAGTYFIRVFSNDQVNTLTFVKK